MSVEAINRTEKQSSYLSADSEVAPGPHLLATLAVAYVLERRQIIPRTREKGWSTNGVTGNASITQPDRLRLAAEASVNQRLDKYVSSHPSGGDFNSSFHIADEQEKLEHTLWEQAIAAEPFIPSQAVSEGSHILVDVVQPTGYQAIRRTLLIIDGELHHAAYSSHYSDETTFGLAAGA